MKITCSMLTAAGIILAVAALAQETVMLRALPAMPGATDSSPVDAFRKLLAAAPNERAQFLALKQPSQRPTIESKLQEYSSLPAAERELRLQLTELRWYMLPLMQTPTTNREAALARIPEAKRKPIESRLKAWDKLSPDVQKEVLANESIIQFQQSSPDQQKFVLAGLTEDRRKKLETEIAQWKTLPSQQKDKISRNFRKFFDLDTREKSKVLNVLSAEEKKEMEAALQQFESLPPAQREECIQSFTKFASMTTADRNRFLRNVEQWQTMTAEERQNWRDLVTKLPPMPPGLYTELPPFPPQLPPFPPQP